MSLKPPRSERLKQAEKMLRNGEHIHFVKETLDLHISVVQIIRDENNIPKNKGGPKVLSPEKIQRMKKAWEMADTGSREEIAVRFGYKNAKSMGARLYQLRSV